MAFSDGNGQLIYVFATGIALADKEIFNMGMSAINIFNRRNDFFIPMPSVGINELPVELIVRLKPELVVNQPLGIAPSILALLAELKQKYGLQAAGTLWPVELTLLEARLPWASSVEGLPSIPPFALQFVIELKDLLGNGALPGDRSLTRKQKDDARMRLLLTFPPNTDPNRIVRRISSVRGVSYVEVDRVATSPNLTPQQSLKASNTFSFGSLIGDLFVASPNADWPKRWMKVPYTYAPSGNSGETAPLPNPPPKLENIAIFDSGVDSNHPGFDQAIDYADVESETDSYGHGTFIAGLIVGRATKVSSVKTLDPDKVSNTIDGIFPSSNVWVSTVFNPTAVRYSNGTKKYRVNPGWYSYALNQIAEVLEDQTLKTPFADRLRKIQVVNLSLGSPTRSRTEEEDINRLIDLKVIIVAASGNFGADVLFPARLNGVLAVGAHKFNSNDPWPHTNGVDSIDVLAPGVDVLSSIPINQNGMGIPFSGWLSGTSMATAYVTAAVAVLKAKDPTLFGEALVDKLRNGDASTPFPLNWPK